MNEGDSNSYALSPQNIYHNNTYDTVVLNLNNNSGAAEPFYP